jgi:hypothetical protein
MYSTVLHRDDLTDLPSLFLYCTCFVLDFHWPRLFNFCSFASYPVSMPRSRTRASALCFSSPASRLPLGFARHRSALLLPIVNHQTSHVDAILRSFIVCLRELISQNPSTVKYCAPMASVCTQQPSKNSENLCADHVTLYNHPRTRDEFGPAVSVQSGEALLFSAQLSRKLKLK